MYILKRFPQKSCFKTKSPQIDGYYRTRKKMKELKHESLNLPTGVKTYLNESLFQFYEKIWTKLKKL